MKFDLISDAHIDHHPKGVNSLMWERIRNEDSNILVIAGDHSTRFEQTIRSLAYARRFYEHVIFVPGNHELYDGVFNNMSFADAYASMSHDLNNVGVTMLLGGAVHINDVAFIGATGWYDFAVTDTFEESKKVWADESNDIHLFENRSDLPEEWSKLHSDMISNEVKKNQDKDIVIITHMVPRIDLMGFNNLPPGTDLLDNAYACIGVGKNALLADINKRIRVWCYGHTHTRKDRIIDSIRYVNNSRGYCGIERQFNTWSLAQIDTMANNNPYEDLFNC
jgi:predicted phosphodiesterase